MHFLSVVGYVDETIYNFPEQQTADIQPLSGFLL